MNSISAPLDDARGRNDIVRTAKRTDVYWISHSESALKGRSLLRISCYASNNKNKFLKSKYRNLIDLRSLPIKNVDYHSVIPSNALVEILLLSNEYGINGLLRFMLDGMQDHHALKN
ncbi:hypothetical protein TNCV_4956081 [Trichonephila clavipes]|nr:hypothetical protein TNCV_4956081 [Trichonephila clavipes]